MTDKSGREKLPLPGGMSAHDLHETKVNSSRTFQHGGQAVEIRAVYEVLVNGVARQLHFTVGRDGKVTTHLRPYVAYDSLVDMVKDVIDHYPGSFDAGEGGHGPQGGGH